MSAAQGQGSFQAPSLGSVLGERYTLLRFLGSGAMGAVYEASTPSGERVAVKVLLEISHEALAEEVAKRFLREAQVASSLDGKHIVSVKDSGFDATLKIPYMVMPLLSGFDLDTLFEKVGVLHPTVAVRIIVQACTGLMSAHQKDVVHRDIKPANLYLDHDPDGSVTVRVLDFGMAKFVSSDEQITRAGSMLGTPDYMSPEQSMNAKSVDSRSDVWGIGATLYHALTGVAPYFEAMTLAELCIALRDQPVKALQERAPWIDPGLAALVHGTLLHDRDKRCPGVSDLRSALIPYLGGATDLHADMLQPVPPMMRQVKATRVALPEKWDPGIPQIALPAPPAPKRDPLLGKKLAGKYHLLRSLGRGSAGGLYEALGPDGNRVAVRTLSQEVTGNDEAQVQRFLRGARALAVIDSPHVVQPIDADYDDTLDAPFVAVELLHGMDLQTLIDRQGPLDPQTMTLLFAEACRGLQHAHECGVTHRDIRPSNIFLVEQPNGHVTVKLTGFGMVKMVEDGAASYAVTGLGEIIGSLHHMAPEQAESARKATALSDVFGMGATLFHALCGTSPWPRDKRHAALMLAIRETGPLHLQDEAPWIYKALTEAVHRALKRDPTKRWPSAEAFADALFELPTPKYVPWHELGRLSSSLKKRVAARADPAEPLPPKTPAEDAIALADTMAHDEPPQPQNVDEASDDAPRPAVADTDALMEQLRTQTKPAAARPSQAKLALALAALVLAAVIGAALFMRAGG